jgi:asparagine synthase (glutamine-hydrolysing)
MCGIAGVFYADPSRPVEAAILRAMGASLAHRGPDAEGFWTDSGLGLVHRRLSIIDLSGGDQPIGNEDGSVQVILNGEIYNYQHLREDLVRKGHRFRTQSDTEVIVHLYEDEGEHFVARLRGMFAIALWDRSKRRLVLARDRVGIKPLYVYRDAEKLVFASELKAILAHPAVERSIDPTALDAYLTFGHVPGPGSIFTQMEKLPPAHTLVATTDNLKRQPQRYWRLSFESDERPTAEDWQEAIRDKVAECVRGHMIADVPVGAFLSGGIDSSIIVSAASALRPDPLQTFSIGFQEERFSELPFAREVARAFQTDHREEIVTPDSVQLLDELTHYFDEPFADASAVPTFFVARLAKSRVKVALSGDGGDEAFGGYARYAHDLGEAALRRRLPGWFRRRALGPLGRFWPKADWLPRPLRLKTGLTNLSLDDGPAYANTLTQCRMPFRRALLAPDVAHGLNGFDPTHAVTAAFANSAQNDPLGGMLAADVATVLPDDFLVKVDRASMAHGLEVRPPLLDHELLELAARIPSRWKVHRGETKWIFKRAFEQALPKSVLSRPKQGFDVPIDAWLRGPLRGPFEDAVLNRQTRIGTLINQATASQLFRSHVAGSGRHGNVLWSLLVLSKWADRYLAATPLPVDGQSL